MAAILKVLDHIVYATPHLESTIRDIADRLGVTPALGGRHSAWGTRNALLAIGERAYLEILAPDPETEPASGRRPLGIDHLAAARLASWVCRAQDLHTIVERGARAGVDLGGVLHGSRARADGTILQWDMTDLMTDREAGTVPYFIDWGDSEHPASSSPQGCSLISFRVFHPDSGKLNVVFETLGLPVKAERDSRARLVASISCPRGVIDLS